MNAVPVKEIATQSGRSISRVWQVMRELKIRPRFKKLQSTDKRIHRTALIMPGQAQAVLNRMHPTPEGMPEPARVPEWQTRLAEVAKTIPIEYTRIVIEPKSGSIILTKMVEERLGE